ncbi:MAG: transcription antitermination factor NusB, partial [Flammeovirgaceae bacterium]|nr:transcription antitermination factor NusB [Flammeovirgaceae bacterium]
FHDYHDKNEFPPKNGIDERYYPILISVLQNYRKKVKDEFYRILKKMLIEAESLVVKYLKILRNVLELPDIAKTILENKTYRIITFVREEKFFKLFSENAVIQLLKKHLPLQREFEKFNIHPDNDEIKNWYHLLLKDVGWEKFSVSDDFEENKSLLYFVIEDFIFKNEDVFSSYEKDDLHWSENSKILKNSLLKAIKELTNTYEDTSILVPLSDNWDDDKVFFEVLYKNTLEEEPHYEGLIQEKSEKWKIERMAKIDKLLINMAITEMVNFPSIPIKVTINEYIDISKKYSTPKSWQFLNGMLDSIAKQLVEEGKIKKSGRGLLDNK